MKKSIFSITSIFFHLDVKLGYFKKNFLSLADVEQIKEVSHRLGIVGARSAADHQRIVLASLGGAERNFCQIQHVQHVGVAHLVLQGKAEEIKAIQGILALQGNQGQIVLFHLLLHIHPRIKGSLAPNVGVLIQRAVKQAHAQIGHTDLIGVGEAEGKTRLHLGFIFDHLSVFSAGIASGLGDRFENGAVWTIGFHIFNISLSVI